VAPRASHVARNGHRASNCCCFWDRAYAALHRPADRSDVGAYTGFRGMLSENAFDKPAEFGGFHKCVSAQPPCSTSKLSRIIVYPWPVCGPNDLAACGRRSPPGGRRGGELDDCYTARIINLFSWQTGQAPFRGKGPPRPVCVNRCKVRFRQLRTFRRIGPVTHGPRNFCRLHTRNAEVRSISQ
jgi:hypothetical protein